jgi:hypothetical protein
MTTIYVRIPRNRWTPIGEVDLGGYGLSVYQDGEWRKIEDPIRLDKEVAEAIQRTRKLREEIRAYQKKHGVTTRHDESLAKNRQHVKHLNELRHQLYQASPYRLLVERAKQKAQEKLKNS